MHERVGLGPALAALPAIPWGKSALAVVRGGLWTANNSFTTFSANTMYLLWRVLLVAAVQYARRGRREPVLWAGIACYALGLIYSTAVKYVISGGEGFAPSVCTCSRSWRRCCACCWARPGGG